MIWIFVAMIVVIGVIFKILAIKHKNNKSNYNCNMHVYTYRDFHPNTQCYNCKSISATPGDVEIMLDNGCRVHGEYGTIYECSKEQYSSRCNDCKYFEEKENV